MFDDKRGDFGGIDDRHELQTERKRSLRLKILNAGDLCLV